MKVHDNLFPQVLFDTTAAEPATPAVGSIALYAKSDGNLYYKDSNGVTHSFGGGTAGGLNDQVGTAYTLALSDTGKDVRCTNAAAITLTVPAEASVAFPVGTKIAFSQGGAGVVTATSDGTTVIRAKNGAATDGQYDGRVLEYLGANEWRVW